MNRFKPALWASLFLIACGGSSPKASSPADGSGDGNATASADSDSGDEAGSAESADSDNSPSGGPSGESGGSSSGADSNEFKIKESKTAGSAHGVHASKIEATKTEAAMKFFVVDKRKEEPIKGIVIYMQGPDGKKYYTEETDAVGYGEVLVPVGQTYEIVYLSLGRKDITAKVTIEDLPRQNIKLTLRYKPRLYEKQVAPPPPPPEPDPDPEVEAPEPPPQPKIVKPGFRLDGVTFESGSAKLQSSSYKRLDGVVEFMTYTKSARIEISGHTDSVGNAKKNKRLSQQRADAVKDYLVKKGIDGGRIEAVGYGMERPIADNRTAAGRAQNRRIEAIQL